MEVFKLVSVAIIISITIIIVKQVKPEFATVLVVLGSAIMLVEIFKLFVVPIDELQNILNKTGIDNKLFGIILKILGVGYLIEFGASICLDTGNSSIADKLILGGKLLILTLAIPIIKSIFNVVIGLIP